MFVLGLIALLLVTPAAGKEEAGITSLGAGESRILGRPDRTPLTRFGEDIRITLAETAKAKAVARLTSLDRDGAIIGVGRVVVVAPAERYELSLRRLFSETQLEGVRLRVEVLRGMGKIEVLAATSDGAGLIVVPEQTGHERRRPVHLKSSSQLIDEAETSGAITSEKAMLYRVFLLFDDTRLPVQYRGTDQEVEDSLYMGEVVERFNTLSPETQALIQPFLIPPAYQGSWASTSAAGPVALGEEYPVPCKFHDGNYQYVDSPGGEARVWFQKGTLDELRAGSFASAITNRIWPKLYDEVMKPHRPLPDDGFDCDGGSPSVDIYLLNIGTNIAVPFAGCSGEPSPTYIYLTPDAELSTVTHELFHAFQDSFRTRKCNTSEDYYWWTEGSAVWASDFVYPNEDQKQQHGWAEKFLDAPERPLDHTEKEHAYGSYLYPFFFHRSTRNPQFVRMAWEGCNNQPALEAVDAVTGTFKVMWPEFALYNWNNWTKEQITGSYFDWDILMAGVTKVTRPVEVALSGVDRVLEIPVDLQRLSATYKHYKFRDDNVRTVAFWNGLTNSLSQPDEFELDDVTENIKKGAHIEALIKIRGQDWKREDWTNRGVVPFCRDRAVERIDELVLIISNSEFTQRDRELKHQALTPRLWVSKMGCWQWKGKTTATMTGGHGLGSTTLKIDSDDATFTSFGLGPPFVFYSAQGNLKWKLSGDCEGEGTIPIDPGKAYLFTHNFTPPGGMKHRGYILNSVDSRPISGYKCRSLENGRYVWRDGEGALLPPWIFNDRIKPPLLEIDTNGFLIDRYADPDGVATYTWELKPQRQPDPPP